MAEAPALGFALALPEWAAGLPFDAAFPGAATKVELAIRLAEENVRHGSGGPFGAAIFDERDRLVAVGVNRVLPSGISLAHAEIMAIGCAQRRLGRFRLDQGGGRYL
ncbi:MAG: nucleoside deaminase, partial [Anaerolineae bacterium]|nr:nucleoside deaminase [Anaerolineae bacterium]